MIPLGRQSTVLHVVDLIGRRGRRQGVAAEPSAPALFRGMPLYHGSPRRGLTVLRADLPMAQRTYPAFPHGALGVHFTTDRRHAEYFAKAREGRPPGELYEALAPPRNPRRMEYLALSDELGEGRGFPAQPGTPHYDRVLRAIAQFRRAMIARGYDSLALHRPGHPEADEIVSLVDVPVRPVLPGAR